MAVAPPLYVADKSALARLRHPVVAAVLAPLIAGGLVATRRVVELERLHSTHGPRDFRAQRRELRGYPHLDLAQADFDWAMDVMESLAQRGQHRLAGLPGLLLAAVAERHGLALLQYDTDFVLIAAITQQSIQWVIAYGSVPDAQRSHPVPGDDRAVPAGHVKPATGRHTRRYARRGLHRPVQPA